MASTQGVQRARTWKGPRKEHKILWRWGDWKRQRLSILDYPPHSVLWRLMMYHCRLEGSYSSLFVPTYRIDYKAESADHVIQELPDHHQAVLLTYFGAIEPRLEDVMKVYQIKKTACYDWLNDAIDGFDRRNKVG